MTCNRLLDFAHWVRGRLDHLQPQALVELERMLEIEPHEAQAYQHRQARARMCGILNGDEALLIYRSLDSDGWTPGLGLELKVTIAALMDRLPDSQGAGASAIDEPRVAAGLRGRWEPTGSPRNCLGTVTSSLRLRG